MVEASANGFVTGDVFVYDVDYFVLIQRIERVKHTAINNSAHTSVVVRLSGFARSVTKGSYGQQADKQERHGPKNAFMFTYLVVICKKKLRHRKTTL